MKEEGYKVGSTNHNLEYIFKPSVTWTKITTSKYSFRINHFGYLFDDASGLCPPKNNFDIYELLGFLNTPIVMQYLLILNPTMNLNPGDIAEIPYIKPPFNNIERIKKCEQLSRDDWDSFEYSFNFSESPLLFFRSEKQMLPFAYKELKQYWNKQTQELMQIEQKINNSYLNLYCLLNEITDEVPLHEVTLLRNVVYRYGARNNQQELEVFDKADTMKEFISYAVGCMFGRYSLDKPGLILADQGETLQDYLRQVPDPSFTPDEDNVLPILDGDWFQDDIKERFKKFLKVTFGEEHYEENLQFIEDAIGRDIRSYFLKEFYPYHLKMYKKRPIYWLFSSPKGTFNALIYMHRYNKDTVSIILNNYLREFKSKLEARKSFVEKISNSTSISPKEKTAAIKELETLKKQLDEITTYESKVLFPLAAKHIEIDLDDGVKANYPKFGEALVKIPGLVDKSE
jgi:type II restriction/modification system DNA methylase subunit YeeA